MTHQQISDRLREIDDAIFAKREDILRSCDNERRALQECCGRVGHIFGHSPMICHRGRQCVVCYAAEKVSV